MKLKIVLFELSKEIYGIKVYDIEEIVKVPKIEEVPNTADFIEGVINRRGNIVPVVNIANKFSLEEKEIDDESRIIIMDMKGEFVGILVDRVIEIIKIDDEEISDPPDISTGIPYQSFIGVYNFNGRMLTIIETAKVLETEVEENE